LVALKRKKLSCLAPFCKSGSVRQQKEQDVKDRLCRQDRKDFFSYPAHPNILLFPAYPAACDPTHPVLLVLNK